MKSCFDYVSLGARIRKIRKQNHMTQEQLAEACDLSTAHIGHIERGTRAASIETLITISKILNISTDYLLLDIDLVNDKRFSDLINSMNNVSEEKYNRLYSIFKVLIENIDKI